MKKLLLLVFSFVSIVGAQAEDWIDVTSQYVKNPHFVGNSRNGWVVSNNGKVDTQYECTEFFQSTFDMYQTITGLTNGKYRIGLNGYYRNGGASETEYNNYVNDNYTNTAYMYGNATQTQMPSIYEQISDYGFPGTTTISWWPTRVVPNTMQSASYYFAAGYYRKTLEVTVTDGTLRIGVRNGTYANSNWCIFTNVTLEYYGTEQTITSMSFPKSSVSLDLGHTMQLTPACTPELTPLLRHKFLWSSSNPSVVRIDSTGVIRGIMVGSSEITCVDQISGKTAKVTVNVSGVAMTAERVIINEIQTANIDQYIDPSGNYGGWVELYNPTSEDVFLGYSWISDHKGHMFQLPFEYGFLPAHGYRNIWFDHCDRYNGYQQVNFKLDIKGGTIAISDVNQTEVARQEYPALAHRTSYGRKTNGGTEWSMTGNPTPEATNTSSSWASEQLAIPEVSQAGCFFTGTLSFNVVVPAGCKLVYTTDGSTPMEQMGTGYTNNSSRDVTRTYSTSTTKIYRFRLFKNGMLPSEVVTRSYLYKSYNYNAPVVSVVANDRDIYGADWGVYVMGNGNGRPGRGQSAPCNWNMDWERAVNFEYLVPDGNGQYSETVLNQLVDFEMCGGWSRAWEPHSFKLKANKIYGESNLDYPFFESKPYNRHKSLQMRNGGNDNGCRFKDAAIQEVIRRSGLYVDGQAWKPVHIFINGIYKRVLNMREPNNKHNAFSNYGIDTDYIDQFEMSPDSGYVQMEGTPDAFNKLCELSAHSQDESVYQFICDSLLDIDSYVNYMAVQFYLGGDDWPQNNVKGFRAIQDDENEHPTGKFHFVIFDLDHAFNQTNTFSLFASKKDYTFDSLYGIDENGNDVTGKRRKGEIKVVSLFLNLLKNNNFKKKFSDAFCLVTGSVFEPSRCESIIREMQTIENLALAIEGGSCNNTANSLVSNFSYARQNTMIEQLRSYLNLAGGRKVTLSSNVTGARLWINSQEVPTGKFSGTWYGTAQVQALAPAGYRFAGWASGSSSVSKYSVFGMKSNWYYYDRGSLDGTNWYSSFPTTTSGYAPLGYATNDTLRTNLKKNLPTYYFSKTFALTSRQFQEDLQLNYRADDGFIVYVNGIEAARYNMPSGSVSYNTVALTYAPNNPDEGSLSLSKTLFREGNNTICVEVHNNSTSSSDILWDASLYYSIPSSDNVYLSTDSIYTLASSSASLVACFEPIGESVPALNYPIKVNEVGAANDVFVNEYWKKNDWIELYNNTDQDIDVAGLYVSDNIDKLTKYQIEASAFIDNTIVPAHGTLVIWADKLVAERQLHTGFKLANEEAMVLVTSSDVFEANNASFFAAHPNMKGYTDVLVYDMHEYNESVGRYPDGGNAIYRMVYPTIGKENRHITQDQFLCYDQGYRSLVGLDEIEMDKAVDDLGQMMEQGTVFYDLQGRRVVRPQSGQLVLRRKYPQK